jgi:hypothetical protein
MASQPKTLRVVAAAALGSGTRTLDVECVSGEPLQPGRGKYIIMATGAMAGDRPVKRAYSLVPIPEEPARARLTIKCLGPGSTALHEAPIGTELGFSGPWGKLVPETGLEGPALVVATDTGITSALGIVGGTGVREVLWMIASDETFLDPEDVRARIEGAGVRFVCLRIPSVGDPRRLTLAWDHVDARLAETRAAVVLAAGDGAVIDPLRERLAGRVGGFRLECFFNNPQRKIASA